MSTPIKSIPGDAIDGNQPLAEPSPQGAAGRPIFSRLDPRRLKHFLAIYEHGTLGRAAAELHLTQPALSKSLNQLEEQLNVKLFERTPMGVVPTIYGETLSLHAKIVESELHTAERELAMLSGAAKGEVRMGVTPSIASLLLPLSVSKLCAERPAININVSEGMMNEHLPALRKGQLDLVIGGATRGMNPDLKTELLMRDTVRVFAAASHPVHQGDWELAALLDHAWAMPPASQFWMTSLERAFIAAGLSAPMPSIVSNSATFIRGMLLQHGYLSCLPSHLLAHELRSGDILPIAADELSFSIDYFISYRKRAVQPAAVSAFIECLHEICRAFDSEDHLADSSTS